MSGVLFDGITYIREELIEEAQTYVFRRQVWKRYAGAAAGLLLAACLGWNVIIGGMGGGASDENTSGSPPVSTDTCTPSAGDCGGEAVFTASVLEVGEGYMLVVPLPGSGFWSVADRVTVPTDGMADLPDIQPGNQIEIRFTGEAAAGSVSGVTGITVLP